MANSLQIHKYNDIAVITFNISIFIINCTYERIVYPILYVYLSIIFVKQLLQANNNEITPTKTDSNNTKNPIV